MNPNNFWKVIARKAVKYEKAEILLTRLAGMGIGKKKIVKALMRTYGLREGTCRQIYKASKKDKRKRHAPRKV